ncbi:uncharacterized protein LOC143374168 [Andrena cerasifolii]|uniref:uncharacterized protein LOC143374168 n=1 Tax=Andrena cerasifolii TaxID=2819439 RepID=UPI004037A040
MGTEVEIYTDGSKMKDANSNGVGIVIAERNDGNIIWQDRGFGINKNATIYTTEAIAIEKAIEYANEEWREKDVLILTDSMCVIKGVRSYEIHKNREKQDNRTGRIRKLLLERERQYKRERNGTEQYIGKIRIALVPAHTGIEGNERTDKKAKEQTAGNAEHQWKIPMEDIRTALMEKTWDKSTKDMREEGKEKGVKYFNLRINNTGKRKPWFRKIANIERKAITTLNRLRANHYNLAESLHRKGIIESPECECGEGIEDINHVLWKCNKYEEMRGELITKMKSKGVKEGDEIMERINETD